MFFRKFWKKNKNKKIENEKSNITSEFDLEKQEFKNFYNHRPKQKLKISLPKFILTYYKYFSRPIKKEIYDPINKIIIKNATDWYTGTVNKLTRSTTLISLEIYDNILLGTKNSYKITKNTITFTWLQKWLISKGWTKNLYFFSFIYKLTIGFLAGVCSIIPGLSGGTIFSATGIWTLVNESISNLTRIKKRKEFKSSIAFLIPLALGMGAGYILFSFFYSWITSSFDDAQLVFYFLFAFITLFSSFLVLRNNEYKVTRKRLAFSLFFFLVIFGIGLASFFFNTVDSESSWYNDLERYLELILAFGLGIIMFSTMIIPGVSGSLLLLVIGLYDFCIERLVSFDIAFIGLFLLGGIIGIILTAKLFEKLIQKHPENTYYSIIGTIYASFASILLISPWGMINATSSYVLPLMILVALLFTIFLSYLEKHNNR